MSECYCGVWPMGKIMIYFSVLGLIGFVVGYRDVATYVDVYVNENNQSKRKFSLFCFSLILNWTGCMCFGVAHWNVLIVKGSYVWVGLRLRYVGIMDHLDFL
jgi:hypothetical protein